MLTNDLEPLIKQVTVSLDAARAFRLFTDGVAGWWPLVSHSVEGEHAATCRFEPYVGGRFYETARAGTEHTWGTILAWEPPHRIVLTWHPGRDGSTAQEVEVTFHPVADGTRVRLVHRGWQALEADAPRVRANYDAGWTLVLSRFAEAA
jgi:uncharacterized protein YndB with AHSA1/START domain